MKNPPAVLGSLGALLGVVGVVLLIFPYEFSALGPVLIGVAAFALALATFWDEGLRTIVSVLVCVLGVLMVLAAAGGLVQRTFTADSYRYRFGDQVTVKGVCPVEEVPDVIIIRRRSAGGQATESCPATWTVDGRQVQGKVKFASSERPPSTKEWPFTMVAYAMGEKASGDSLDLDREYGVLRWAAVPLWVGGAGVGVFVLGLLIESLFRPRQPQSVRVAAR